MRHGPPDHSRLALPAIAATAGAVWGAVAYVILWGETSIVVTRRFVDSVPGLAALLPVRIVLFAIHLAEADVAHRPFRLASNHTWIGYVSAAVGGLLGVAAYALVAGVVRLAIRRRHRPISRAAL